MYKVEGNFGKRRRFEHLVGPRRSVPEGVSHACVGSERHYRRSNEENQRGNSSAPETTTMIQSQKKFGQVGQREEKGQAPHGNAVIMKKCET